MRYFRTILAIGFLMVSPILASATVYNFNDTETSALSSSPVNFTFSLDTTKAVSATGGATFNNVVINDNGVLFTGNTVEATFGTNLSSPLFFLIDTSLLPFYTGTGTGIVFNTGTFAIADGATDGVGTIMISTNAISTTPEPAAWALLLTGCVTTLGARFRSGRSRVPRTGPAGEDCL